MFITVSDIFSRYHGIICIYFSSFIYYILAFKRALALDRILIVI